MNEDQLKHAQLLREAFNEYLVNVHEMPLNPAGNQLSYDFSFIDGRKLHTLADEMVRSDLQELTNLINGWSSLLYRWHAWSMVLEGREERETWELRSEFLDSMLHECLLMPASIRDAITSVATAAFHQVRLSIDQSYRDYLEGDPETPEKKAKSLNQRWQKEKRLSGLVQVWPNSSNFLKTLREINTSDYVAETYDYRNLTAHTIGPRLGIGHTRIVKRSVKQAQALKQIDDGSYVVENVPGKLTVSYGYGGTPPLNLEVVRAANLDQYEKARSCYVEYRALLEAVVKEIEPIGGV